jgi:hypothetical protein
MTQHMGTLAADDLSGQMLTLTYSALIDK